MFFSVDDVMHSKVLALDDELGSVQDLYFDDQDWEVRYLVLEAGGWLSGRDVLISPVSAGPMDVESHRLPVNLTRAQIEESPSVDTVLPVSRQQEAEMAAYYGWPAYWGGYLPPPEAILPAGAAVAGQGSAMAPESRAEPQLRSMAEMAGYKLEAHDGEIGHVVDFLIEQESWKVRYLVVDTGSVFSGKKVLLAPLWIDRITWADQRVTIDLSTNQIRTALKFEERTPLTREYEKAVFEHFSRPKYWQDE